MSFELSIKVKISPNAVVTWIHGPWYADAIYEGLRANHGMSKKNVDDALAELRREGLVQSRADGEPEMCFDTRRGDFLKAEFCRLAEIDSPPDARAGMRLVMMFQTSCIHEAKIVDVRLPPQPHERDSFPATAGGLIVWDKDGRVIYGPVDPST